MYLINKEKNRVEKITKISFAKSGFKERDNLQEWIVKSPNIFDEELLIIQKEFAGFDDTKERLDLLALDKNGDLVIIENKLDDTGRDVTWQALKYTSYCSSLSKDNIKNIYQDYLNKQNPEENAEEKISEFLENEEYEEIILNKGVTQKIILVAAEFRKEVTSTVLWLLNYKIRIQCFKATPYEMGDQLFLTMDQIIPTKEAEEYMIRVAEKTQDDIDNKTELKNRHIIRQKFWGELLQIMNSKSKLFQNISPSKSSWIGAGSGVSGVPFNFVASKKYGRVELYIDKGNQEENKKIYDALYDLKTKIEKDFGNDLVWERLDTKRASRIKSELSSNIFLRDNWSEMMEFMIDNMILFEKAIKTRLMKVWNQIK
jgi:hypothetical protein